MRKNIKENQSQASEKNEPPFFKQNFFQFVVENIQHYAIFAIARDGRIVSWNPGVETILGYSSEEFIGKEISVIFTPEDVAAKVPMLEAQRAEATGKGEDQRWHVRKDGSRFWANGLVMPLEDEAGEPLGFVKILRDDTPRKMMEIALREKEELYRTVVENYPNGAVFVFDRELRFLVAGGKGLTAVGASGEMYIGKTLNEAVPPETVAIIEPLYRAALGGESGAAEIDFEGRVYQLFYSPVKSEMPDSGIKYGMVLTQDVTDRKRAESTLRESEENYRTLFNSIDEGFCIIEMLFDSGGKAFDWRFLQVNPAFEKHNGLTQAEGKTILELVPNIETRWLEVYGKVAETGESVRFVEYSEALERWFDLYAFRVGKPEDRKIAVLFNDITARRRAENQIERLNRRNTDILDSITDAFFSLDRDWNFTYVNREAERLLLRRADELIGKSVWDEFPEAIGSTFYKEYTRALETNQTATFEEFYPPLESWFDVRVYPSASGLSVYFHNVNERKRNEQALSESAEKLRLALESGGMGWWSYDPLTNRSQPDEKCLALFGIEPENYNGDADMIFEAIHPEDRQYVQHAMTTAIENHGIYDTEFRVIRPKDGAICWLAGIGRATYDEKSGAPLEMFGVNFDVTERRQTEETLRRSEERFRGLQQATPDGFMIFEAVRAETGKIEDFRWLYVNPAAEKIIGRAEKELIGKLLLDEMPGNREEGLFDAYVRVVETGEVWRKEFSYAHEGLDHYFLSTAVKTGDGFAVAFSDITDRKRAEREREELLAKEQAAREQAEAAARTKDEFLAVVTHELRSPLNSILGWNTLLRRQPSPEMVSRVTEIVEKQGKQQLQLIEDLLDTARMVSGKMIVEQNPVDLASVISAALDVVRPAAQSKSVALSMTINSSNGIVTGDAERLQQVVWNLLANAVKFTPEGGRVEIELRREDPSAVLVVRDNGRGIEPDFLPYVFDRFSQADASKSRRFGGLGLGLSLVKQLTELHGGTVTAESEGLNKGAAFTVKLPIRAVSAVETSADGDGFALSWEALDKISADGNGRQSSSEPEKKDGDNKLAGARILVADDLPDARELVKLALEKAGAKVEAFDSGAAALDALGDDSAPVDARFDLFICDIGMPGEDGYSVVRRLRHLEETRGGNLPAIALTAFSSAQDKARALEAGFQMHISKPVEPEDLTLMVASLLTVRKTV